MELERWPPPPHARVSLFIYPVHHAVFPVTTGGGSGPRSAEVAAVGLIHCRWHLTARFVMFLDALYKAWLAKKKQKTMVSMPRLANDQIKSLAGETFVHFLVSLYNSPPKVIAIGALKGAWLGNVRHLSWNSFKIRPYSEQKNRNEARHHDAH